MAKARDGTEHALWTMSQTRENLEVGSSAESEIRRIRRVGCANGHTGKEDWSVHDFVGRYHAHKLEKNRQSLATPRLRLPSKTKGEIENWPE